MYKSEINKYNTNTILDVGCVPFAEYCDTVNSGYSEVEKTEENTLL